MKRWFKYVDVMLWKKWVYTPSYTIIVPALVWKATIEDEITIWIQTPNSVFNLGYVDVIDQTIDVYVTELFALWGMHWIKEITNTEARDILIANWYVETDNGFLIHEAITDWWIETPAKYLII